MHLIHKNEHRVTSQWHPGPHTFTFQVLYRPCAALPSKPPRHPLSFSVEVTALNVILPRNPIDSSCQACPLLKQLASAE